MADTLHVCLPQPDLIRHHLKSTALEQSSWMSVQEDMLTVHLVSNSPVKQQINTSKMHCSSRPTTVSKACFGWD